MIPYSILYDFCSWKVILVNFHFQRSMWFIPFQLKINISIKLSIYYPQAKGIDIFSSIFIILPIFIYWRVYSFRNQICKSCKISLFVAAYDLTHDADKLYCSKGIKIITYMRRNILMCLFIKLHLLWGYTDIFFTHLQIIFGNPFYKTNTETVTSWNFI